MKKPLLPLTLLFLLIACAGTRTKAPAKSYADRWDITIYGTPMGTISGILNLVEGEDGIGGTFSAQGEVYELQTVFAEAEKLSAVFFFPAYDVDVDIVLEGEPTLDTLEGETFGEYRTIAERVSNP